MFTVEEKVDLILEYLTTKDNVKRVILMPRLVEALNSRVLTSTSVDVDDLISDLLRELGMPQHLSGYRYVVKSIKLYIFDPSYRNHVTSRLYPDVAHAYGVPTLRVEKSIRYAIAATFDNGDLENITRAFGNTISVHSGRLTPNEFISACTNEIIRRMKKLGIAGM